MNLKILMHGISPVHPCRNFTVTDRIVATLFKNWNNEYDPGRDLINDKKGNALFQRPYRLS